jgi:hypothetical protein
MGFLQKRFRLQKQMTPETIQVKNLGAGPLSEPPPARGDRGLSASYPYRPPKAQVHGISLREQEVHDCYGRQTNRIEVQEFRIQRQ